MFIKDLFEQISEVWYGYWIATCKAFGEVLTFLFPIVFGVTIKEAYPLINFTSIFSVANLNVLGPSIIIIIFWWMGTLLRGYVKFKQNKSQELFNAVKWMCEDLGTRDNTSEDIRCTIWVPVTNKTLSKENTNTLIQAIDYYPPLSEINGTNRYHVNGKKFRAYKVTDKGTPIGILGYTTLGCIDGGGSGEIELRKLNRSTDFLDHMVKDWGFSKAKAIRLRSDRKSFVCVPLLGQGKTRLIGILYMDSCKSNALEKIIPYVDNYIERFARIITSE